MASFNTYTGNGSQTNYALTFPYLSQDHVVVLVDGEENEDWSWFDASTIQFDAAPANGALIRVKRVTPGGNSPLAEFQNGEALLDTELNISAKQALFVAEEATDRASGSVELSDETGQWDFQEKRATNAADPEDDQDLVTKAWAETEMSSQLAQALAAKDAAEDAQEAAETAQEAAEDAEAAAEADRATVAADKTTISGWKDTVAADKATVASDKATVASDKATVAADKATVAADKATVASDKATVASDKATVASDKATTHADMLAAAASAAAAATSEANAANSAAAAAAAVGGATVFIGAWDASTGVFPGSGSAQKGSYYSVSVAGTVNGVPFDVGDQILAIVNNASTTTYAANWIRAQGVVSSADVTNALGFTPLANTLASQAEAEGGTENTKPMTALRTAQAIAALVPTASQVEAEAGSNNTKFMTPLRVWQAIAAYVAASIQDALVPHSTVVFTMRATAPSGWLLFADQTMGGASSGATSASASNVNVFTELFNNASDANCPLLTSAGAGTTRAAQGTAAAAWAAGCRMTMPKALGRALAVAGSGSGLTARTFAATFGAETETPTTAKTAAHTHNIPATDGSGAGPKIRGIADGDTVNINVSSGSAGSGNPLNITSASLGLNAMVKL